MDAGAPTWAAQSGHSAVRMINAISWSTPAEPPVRRTFRRSGARGRQPEPSQRSHAARPPTEVDSESELPNPLPRARSGKRKKSCRPEAPDAQIALQGVTTRGMANRAKHLGLPITQEALDAVATMQQWMLSDQEAEQGLRELEASSGSPTSLREKQCVLLTTARPSQNAPRIVWPEPSDEAKKRIAGRHQVFEEVSESYSGAQRRMLFLLDVPDAERWAAFDRECFLRRLAPTTAETYWTAWMSLKKQLELGPDHADKKVSVIMRTRAATYPVRFPNPIREEHIDCLRNQLKTKATQQFAVTAMIVACWVTGQRFGDFIQLATNDVKLSPRLRIGITMRRGKMLDQGVVKPYTLFIKASKQDTQNLLIVRQHALDNNMRFLLTVNNSDDELERIELYARKVLANLAGDFEIRSIRRGGLQHMASHGVPMETVRFHSRHKDVGMLRRYLDHGLYAAEEEEKMCAATDVTSK